MQKVDQKFKLELIKFLKDQNHEHFTTHKILCFHIIYRIYIRVVKYGTVFGPIKINEENKLIIDGNHRYVAYKLSGKEFEILDWCKNHSDESKKINDIELDLENDWDLNCSKNKKYCDIDYIPKFN